MLSQCCHGDRTFYRSDQERHSACKQICCCKRSGQTGRLQKNHAHACTCVCCSLIVWLQLRFDYDTTTTSRVHLLPIRCKQKMNMWISCHSRILVVSQLNRTLIVISITSVVVECIVLLSYRSRIIVESQLWYRFCKLVISDLEWIVFVEASFKSDSIWQFK